MQRRFSRNIPAVCLTVTLVLTALLIPSGARAVWPPPDTIPCVNQADPGTDDLIDPNNQPNDPGYQGDWNYWCFIHPDVIDRIQAEYEKDIGSGFHADRAWQKTIGDRRVIIAVLDSGIRWREDDLVNKYYLNRGELPPPDSGCTGGATEFDLNGDGFFNVQDYTTNTGGDLPTNPCDTRILAHDGGNWDTNGNTFLDPQDLIRIFSDGVDDDNNGYIDDISGWDFFHDDNDANDDTEFGHGSGEAKDSGAEGNNGRGGIGVCPECSILMLRVGDSFVVDVNNFSMATVYAVDSGACVVQEALGAVNHTRLSMDAIDYAWQNDVTIIGSAADEDSYHHNFPGTNNHTIYVHAIRFDSNNWRFASTYLNFNNCTNYGAQLALSTPGTGCSSEATGRTSGIAGLIYSMALQQDVPFPNGQPHATDHNGARRLRADEVRQLMIMTVDDIHDTAAASDPLRYPTRVGWEMRFGYGRTNVGNAVREIEANRIPPVTDITEPLWFQVLYPEQTPSVDIVGELSFRTDIFDSIDWVLEWAPGIEPDDSDFTTIGSGNLTQRQTGTLATWDISGITVDNPEQDSPDRVANRYMVTLRLRAETRSTNGALDGVKGELRKAVNIVRDPDLLPGFPFYLDASGEASLKMADLDGDGRAELIVADGNGQVRAFRADATVMPGWENVFVNALPHLDPDNPNNHRGAPGFATGAVDSETKSSIMATPAIGDLEGNGSLEVVVVSWDGYVYVFNPDGSEYDGFPVHLQWDLAHPTDEDTRLDSAVMSSPVLEDLDGDGDYEIIVVAHDGHLYVWHHDGQLDSGFPVALREPTDVEFARSMSTPAVGDMDGDGIPDIAMGTNQGETDQMGHFYAVHGDGNNHPGGPFLTGYPIEMLSIGVLPMVGTGIVNAPAMADVDGDGLAEVAIEGIASPVKLYDGDGTIIRIMENSPFGPDSDSTDEPTQCLITNPSFGDINNDGKLDVVQGGAGLAAAEAFASGGVRINFDHHVSAWDVETGLFHPAFPRRVDDWQFFHNPSIADITGDGLPEIINGTAGYYVRAFDHTGAEPAGWPKFTGQWIISTAAVGDMTGDGMLEVAVNTRTGFLYVWQTNGRVDGRVDWASFHHDNRNTGNYMNELELGTKVVPKEKKDGCNCSATDFNDSSTGLPLVLLFVLGLGLAVKRRRTG